MNPSRTLERCVRFGEHGQLAGIVTEPAGRPRAGALLVTAGLTPKFGPFRLYAQLARRLAADGLRVLRFDLGGIGDSGQADAALPIRERTEREIAAAVDELARGETGSGLLLAGLCSGAEDAFRYAAIDSRVTALALIDPFGYRTFGWRWRDGLIRLARRGLAAAGLLPTYRSGAPRARLVDYRHMDAEECRAVLARLLPRGVRMHFVYTGGMREHFNHKGQFRRMFRDVDFRGLATLDFFPQLRHTQVLEADRKLVIDSIARNQPYAESRRASRG
jgi:pimeloyl-ACP methyl ester carboxylesterase